MKAIKNDRPGYSCERTQWVLVTGAEPLNRLPACVLRRSPFDGMKPNFRHRRPVINIKMISRNATQKASASQRFVLPIPKIAHRKS